jgi:DNA-binding response OmpR family regulator
MSFDNRSRIVRVGLFEADLATAELRKEGATLALQVQPFQVRALLLKQPRELLRVSSFERKSGFGHIDFDHPLNTAISKIRLALGDDAEHSKYSETLPRRATVLSPLWKGRGQKCLMPES